MSVTDTLTAVKEVLADMSELDAKTIAMHLSEEIDAAASPTFATRGFSES